MLKRKLYQRSSFFMLLFFAVLRSKAGFGPLDLNEPSNINKTAVLLNDTSLAIDQGMLPILTPEIPLHSSMKSFVSDYAENNDELFEKIKLNKIGYFKTIDKIFTQYEIPVELKYLAVVESKLKTNARSGCGAMGIWQFMPATAKRFGLKITAKYDERQHVWKSSVAAAKYLNYLHEFLGDWLLVVAAYNSGPAPVLNAIKKSGSRNFWQLQYLLPKETRQHVKRFIATHYYFEGQGSIVTLGKTESEKYLKALEVFNEKNKTTGEQDKAIYPFEQCETQSQLVAIVTDEKYVKLILKK